VLPATTFWIGFAPLAMCVGVAGFRLFMLGLNIPALLAVLTKLLQANDFDRFQKLLRAGGRAPAAQLVQRAFELRDQALAQAPREGFVVGYGDQDQVDFEGSLRSLVAPDLAKQKARLNLSLYLALPGLLAPVWLWLTTPVIVSAPAQLGASVLLVLLTLRTAFRAYTLSGQLHHVLNVIVPLLDPRK
jgi:hypothetical protein